MSRVRLFLILSLCSACNALLGNEEGQLVGSGGAPSGGSAGATVNGGAGGSANTGGSTSGGSAGLATGGSPSGGGGSGDGGSGGATSGAGGSAGSATCTNPVCEDPPASSCPIVAVALGNAPLIDSMSDLDSNFAPNDGRLGNWWATDDQTGTTTPSTQEGKALPTTLAPARASSTMGMHFSGANHTIWGGVVGISLNWQGCYDASKYGGIRFWAKSEGGTASTRVEVGSYATSPCDRAGSCTQCPCTPNSKTIALEANWQEYVIPWSDFTGGSKPLDPKELFSVAWSNPAPGWDVWIDDVSFIPIVDAGHGLVCDVSECTDPVANGVTCCVDDACGADTGAGCGPGSGSAPDILYDFETSVDGWSYNNGDDVTLASDAAMAVTGTHSLKATLPALTLGSNRNVLVGFPEIWPGAVVTLHVWTPAGNDGLQVQPYTLVNDWHYVGSPVVALNRGGWTPVIFTTPPWDATFPGGLRQLGLQFAVYGGSAFAGGDVYIDSISATGGVAECSGDDAGNQTFESSAGGWQVEGGCMNAAIEQSADRANGGTHSLKVTFDNLPASAACSIILPVGPAGAKVYCGDTVTAYVWTPTGSNALTFHLFSSVDNYVFDGGMVPSITRNAWTTDSYTLPSSIGPGGVQQIGIQFMNSGAAFSGAVYIDDVSW